MVAVYITRSNDFTGTYYGAGWVVHMQPEKAAALQQAGYARPADPDDLKPGRLLPAEDLHTRSWTR